MCRPLTLLVLAAAGCGGPTADNSAVRTPDHEPIGAPKFVPPRGADPAATPSVVTPGSTIKTSSGK